MIAWIRARLGWLAVALGALLPVVGYFLGRSRERARQGEANRDAVGGAAVAGAESSVRDDARDAETRARQAEIFADAERAKAHPPETPEQAERENAATAARIARLRGRR